MPGASHFEPVPTNTAWYCPDESGAPGAAFLTAASAPECLFACANNTACLTNRLPKEDRSKGFRRFFDFSRKIKIFEFESIT